MHTTKSLAVGVNLVPIRKFEERDGIHVRELVNSILFKEFPLSSNAYQIDDLDCISKSYNGPHDVFFVAEKNSKIIGTIAVKEDTSQIALLRRVYVHPNYRNKGCGLSLMDTAIDFCKKNGYHYIVFRSTDQMKEAIRLCLKKGFGEQERLNIGDIHIIKFSLKI